MAKKTDLEIAESSHRYTDPRTGERVTSVTTIVGAFDSGNKLGAGAYAAVKIEREGGKYEDEWGAKRDIGSRVHSYADLWLKGKTAEVPNDDRPWMDAFAAWCRKVKPEWIAAEAAGVGSAICMGCAGEGCAVCKGVGKLGFGGRFDGLGWWEEAFHLGDFKTGRHYRPELTIQLAGYANFDGLIKYDENGRAVDLEPLPFVDKWCGIYIRPEGVEVIECPDSGKVADDWTLEDMRKEAYETFRSLLYVKEWAKQIDRKGR
jgi:hypothetical protein